MHIDNFHTAGYVFKVSFLPGKNCSSEQAAFKGLWCCLWNIGEPKTPNVLCENPVRQKVNKGLFIFKDLLTNLFLELHIFEIRNLSIK